MAFFPLFGMVMNKMALEIQHLDAWHDHHPIIQDFNLSAKQGETIALVSACKSSQLSLLDSLLGINTNRKGSILIHQTEAIHLTVGHTSNLGMALCSKETGLIFELSCEENLLIPLTDHSLGGGLPLTEIYDLFPSLIQYKDSPCSSLSPGEQQLLALARVLRTGTDIIILNDLYGDLCPVIHPIAIALLEKLKQRGYTLILNECNKPFAASLADRLFCIQNAKAHPYQLKRANNLISV